MKSSNETTFPYLLMSTALGVIAAILLVRRSGAMSLQYIITEGRNKGRSFMKHAIKLRDTVYTLQKRDQQLINGNGNSVEIGSETERRSYEEQKRNYLGG